MSPRYHRPPGPAPVEEMLRRVIVLETTVEMLAELHHKACERYKQQGLPRAPKRFVWGDVPPDLSDPNERNRVRGERERAAPTHLHRWWIAQRDMIYWQMSDWRDHMDAVRDYLPEIARGPWLDDKSKPSKDRWTALLAKHLGSLGGVFNRMTEGDLPYLNQDLAPGLLAHMPFLEECRADLKSIPADPPVSPGVLPTSAARVGQPLDVPAEPPAANVEPPAKARATAPVGRRLTPEERDAQETKVRDYIRAKRAEGISLGRITRDGIATATGVSAGGVSKTKAWNALVLERRQAEALPPPGGDTTTDPVKAAITSGAMDAAMDAGDWKKVQELQEREQRRGI